MARREIKLRFLAPVSVGQRIAIETYRAHPDNPVIVDLATGIRWSFSRDFAPSFEHVPTEAPLRKSEAVVRACWVLNQTYLREIHTILVLEDAPPVEGPYR